MRMVPFLIPSVLLLSAYKAGTKKNNRAPFPSPGGLYDKTCLKNNLSNDIDQ